MLQSGYLWFLSQCNFQDNCVQIPWINNSTLNWFPKTYSLRLFFRFFTGYSHHNLTDAMLNIYQVLVLNFKIKALSQIVAIPNVVSTVMLMNSWEMTKILVNLDVLVIAAFVEVNSKMLIFGLYFLSASTKVGS